MAVLCPLLLLLALPPLARGSPEKRVRQACDTCRGITERFSQVRGRLCTEGAPRRLLLPLKSALC